MSKRKLLLADDSVTIQKVVSLTFADEGIEVISTGDGDSAMSKVSELKPDLVMADVNMPGLNGYQICEKIINDQSISRTPVILLVGSFEPFDENEARRVGADDFMTKPFQSIRQLVNKVTVLINSGDTAETASVSVPAPAAEAPQENGSAESAVAAPAQVESIAPVATQAMDDEMVQAKSHAAPFAYYETNKFESRETPISESAPAIFEPEPTPVSFTETATEPVAKEDEMPHAASILEFDDDILELPIFDDEMDEEGEVLAAAPAPIQATAETVSQPAFIAPAVQEPETSAPSAEVPPSHFEEKGADMEVSPELVEAVTRKVMERLSEQAVKDVAWEVVPEMAERIIKQMAEEKLKG